MRDSKAHEGKLYQDQIYGAKVLSPLAVEIMDTPEFQRLGHIRQLGFADVMYRGARHSRLEHSVGTYFLSRTIMRRIVQNHERLSLEHPGKHVSPALRYTPDNSDLPEKVTTFQSRWRGLVEAVSAAALLHDLGHVPFGHTLEDEFAGLYPKHDRLAGPRLYEMLFNETSDLAKVFSDTRPPWLGGLSNQDLQRLIYVILNWKDTVDPPTGFSALLQRQLRRSAKEPATKQRLQDLTDWYKSCVQRDLFHPFMSDIVGNTICADIMDYLPRDRQNLGMEPRLHTRLQRYFTIRPGTLYPQEGLRVSIMVTRKGRGGQRRDVATAVLDIMRERYEMAERVYYHHKKAAASAMLAKLVALARDKRPRDDDQIYPAPWMQPPSADAIPHMTHLSDFGLIDYLYSAAEQASDSDLPHRLYSALRYRRRDMYRTLLVVDGDLVSESRHSISYFAKDLRGTDDEPTSEGRLSLESQLAAAAGANDGDVIIYCPSPTMQSKEVDIRVEIVADRILPLRVQRESFAYHADVAVLQQYYEELWRAYIFVSPEVFSNATKCKAVVDAFCEHYSIPPVVAYNKVRNHDFVIGQGVTITDALEHIQRFFDNLPFRDLAPAAAARLLAEAGTDKVFLSTLASGGSTAERLSLLFQRSILRATLSEGAWKGKALAKKERQAIEHASAKLLTGEWQIPVAALGADWTDFGQYTQAVVDGAISRWAGNDVG
jgi:HD superfamily phosphohydrolase